MIGAQSYGFLAQRKKLVTNGMQKGLEHFKIPVYDGKNSHPI